ncbi:ATP-binding protein [Methanobrevibacter filiformis]|uniref:Putative AAA-ATPase n=1 Tax=Methanobrevibacter filiformis TaxID=55758 RepID=A0A166AAZ3_9EURY|nr:ATP-binding protein [Methanobrevibacter filiformis]KZX11802.1 putative AAA-ATPase [Methanobrevibacter filiformis]
MQILPLGTQDFRTIRENNYIYVDKTKYLHEMITSGRIYFLSRPRRFGKSLLLNTLKELFKGNKQLFEGLHIYDKWDWNVKYPVIHLDLSVDSGSSEKLESSLIWSLDSISQDFDIILSAPDLQSRFKELIIKLNKTYNQKVVVLVDEYDIPIIDNINNLKLAESNREILQNFYRALKTMDEYIRFIFITGVSKFANVSIFSALNNPTDITLDNKFATICGYTQEELEEYFSEYISKLAEELSLSYDDVLEKIKYWYDGYSWDGGNSVYNPQSTMTAFNRLNFNNYWFKTGTPRFLIDFMKLYDIKHILEPVITDESSFDSFDIEDISEIGLLFQTGYLTVKKLQLIDEEREYTLAIPNNEVKNSTLKHLLNIYTKYPDYDLFRLIKEMKKQLLNLNGIPLENNFKKLLANIPYQLHIQDEHYYHSLLLTWLQLLGFDIKAEDNINKGRIDAVLTEKNTVIIAEFKYSKLKEIKANEWIPVKTPQQLLEKAKNQIHKKEYYQKYYGKKIILLQAAFAAKDVKTHLKLLDSY